MAQHCNYNHNLREYTFKHGSIEVVTFLAFNEQLIILCKKKSNVQNL